MQMKYLQLHVRFFFKLFSKNHSAAKRKKLIKYLMSLNHSETEIILFLQLWFNIMDYERRPMIT